MSKSKIYVNGSWVDIGGADIQFAVAQSAGDEATKQVVVRPVTIAADGTSTYSGEARTVLYTFDIPTGA